MNIPLDAGRDFQRTDRAQGVRTAIVSQTLAKRLATDGNVIGRHIRVGTEPEDQDLEIIGVSQMHGWTMRAMPIRLPYM